MAYALSPIDLIPDFIPVVGYLDDLVLVPAGIALVLWLMPADVMAQHREQVVGGDAETLQGGMASHAISADDVSTRRVDHD